MGNQRNPWTEQELQTVAAMAADGHPAPVIAAAIGRSENAIYNLRKQKGGFSLLGRRVATTVGSQVPADFAERWETASNAQLAVHYQRSSNTIREWCKRSELSRPSSWKSPKYAAKARPSVVRTIREVEAPRKRVGHQNRFQTAPIDRPSRDASPSGQAADYLRRFGAVYRCTATGAADAEGTHWRRGNAVLTDAELIERADYNRSRERIAA